MEYYLPVYAVLLIVGGIIGFKKAGSKVSLYAGVVSGFVVATGLYMESMMLVFLTSLLLIGSFTARFLKTKTFMPAGMLLVLSLIAAVISFLALSS